MKDFFGTEFHPTETYKLINLLVKAKIPFEVREFQDTPQIFYPSIKDWKCDAICHSGSYGHEKGLLEIMGVCVESDYDDDVEGYLTAEEVFERIRKHFFEEN